MIKPNRFQCKIIKDDHEDMLKRFMESEDNDNNGVIHLRQRLSASIWDSLAVLGHESIIIVVIDKLEDKIAGIIIISLKKCYFHGKLLRTAYISGLKIGKAYRGAVVSPLLFENVKEFYRKSQIDFTYYSVFTSNKRALNVFMKPNNVLPVSQKIEKLNTYLFKHRMIPGDQAADLDINPATEQDIDDILEFIRNEGKCRANLPNYSYEELASGRSLLNGLCLKDVVVARKRGTIIGMMAFWDQSKFRSWMIHNYSVPVRVTRTLINLIAGLFHYPLLPPVNSKIDHKMLSLILFKRGRLDIFANMFNYLMSGEINNRSAHYSITLSSESPLNVFFKKRSVVFTSFLFQMYYPDIPSNPENINISNLYIEQGSL